MFVGTQTTVAQELTAVINSTTTNNSEETTEVYGPHYKPEHHTVSMPPPQTLEQLICSYPWNCTMAMRVARCESTMNPRAYAAGNYGLFQVNGIHASQYQVSVDQLYDPVTNVRIAYDLYQRRGWQPWQYCSR